MATRPGSWVLTGMSLAVCAAAFAWQAARYGQWLVDDSMISFAYARTLSEGGGPAQQLGAAPVEGFSNPTWTLLLAGLARAGLFLGGHTWFQVPDYVLVPKVLGGLCFVATLVLGHVALRAFLPPARATLGVLVAGLFLAASPGYVIWAVGGLENPLYGLFVAALATVVCRSIAAERLLQLSTALGCSGLALLAALTRPDGAIYAGVYPLAVLLLLTRERWWPSVRAVVGAVLAFVVPAAILLLVRHAVFGLWLPNTAVAKSQGGLSLQSVLRLEDLVAATTPVLAVGATVLAAAAFATVVLRRRQRAAEGRHVEDGRSDELWPAGIGLLLPFALAVVAFGVLNRDWMGMWRFATPFLVTGALLLGAGTAVLAAEAGRWVTRLLVPVAALALVASMAAIQAPRVDRFLVHPSAPGCYVVERYGRTYNFIADQLGVRHGTLLAPDLGGLLLTSRLTVVDLAGLTDERIGRLRSHHDYRGVADYVFDELHPTFIHTHRPWSTKLVSDSRMRRQYVPLLGRLDWVRKSAVPAGFDLARLRAQTKDLVAEADRARVRTPTSSCGRLEVGQLPQL